MANLRLTVDPVEELRAQCYHPVPHPSKMLAHHGLEDRQVKLGCAMPGESPAIFGDALLRLANAATYLYRDGIRYWYSTQPTVKKLAEDRAEQIGRDPDKVLDELAARLRSDLMSKGDFTITCSSITSIRAGHPGR